jgi:hypothetical protein
MAILTTLINKIMAWVDSLFSIFGNYSKDYSKWIVYIVAGLVLAKMLKIKLNIGK